ncbi:NAD-dependent epimerase/dehydratase family protein [Azospirillum agricola]|uniref:NAD-dependent epimerase/dehydratase family protein n=1 Tax=Azospirillum agricola TaxID=1720247 RepID=UPI000A0F3239|nr:NAD-dependent epimerase/dehydratase family protein [Azospirillum agricola]SMH41509.1 UDP-glucose 4-epimerase [Azospirillum lipoferum]
MDIRGKKLVVVGGAGLIGSHTIDALLKHDVAEVIVYDNFVRGTMENLADALKDTRVRIFEVGGDIGQTDILASALKGADGVFHFAALWLLQCYDFPRAAFDVNIRGTFNVLEACVEANVQRLVYSSSASVYGDAVEEPMTEDHPFNNTNFYGATKIAGEAMARAIHHRHSLPYVGLRYMNVYGPRQDYKGAYIAVIMKMLDAIDRGDAPVIYGDGSQAYDFVAVTDCAQANVCAMQADPVDRFYNVGTGVRTSIRELAEMVVELTGCRMPIRYEPGGMTFVKNRIGSTHRARKEIGFEAKVSLRDGLAQLISWRDSHKAEVEARRAKFKG